jgi:hypothetical protein
VGLLEAGSCRTTLGAMKVRVDLGGGVYIPGGGGVGWGCEITP